MQVPRPPNWLMLTIVGVSFLVLAHNAGFF